MKKLFLAGLCASLFAIRAGASVYTLTPNPSDINDLDHDYYYTWGLNWTVPAGQTITGATLTFSQIWDWTVESDDILNIHLLDSAPLGVSSGWDNQSGGDYFATSQFSALGIAQIKLGSWTDPNGGTANTAQNISFVFNAAQLAALQNYISSPGANGSGRFGLGFDPDCHYFNNGVSFIITTSVPEGGSAGLLLAIGFAGVLFLRRKLAA
jgi:hypothetical protein